LAEVYPGALATGPYRRRRRKEEEEEEKKKKKKWLAGVVFIRRLRKFANSDC
jgi:hypothetical protein